MILLSLGSNLPSKFGNSKETLLKCYDYFNNKGVAKVQIAVAKGKKQYDKRHTKKTKDWEREKSRVFRKS